MVDHAGTATEEAQGELSLARIALAEDDLQHAANHLAAAVAHAPDLLEVHQALAELAARCPDDNAIGLFQVDEEVFVGTAVARAHLLARLDPGGALSLIAGVTGYDPSRPWADVLWVRTLDVRTVDPDLLVGVFVEVMQVIQDPDDHTVRAVNMVYLDLAQRAVEGYPDHALIHGAAAGLARRLGKPALAVRWGARGWRLEPTKLTAVWYAYALKVSGRLHRGLEVMREASERYPLDLDLCADMADWLAEAGRLDEALTVIERALEVDASYDCAVHTAHKLRYQRDGDPRHLVDLADFIRTHPVPSHEHSDLADCCHARPWLGMVTGPTEACVNVLAKVPAAQRAGLATLSLSALEVPSALALLRRECPGVQIQIAGSPAADMLEPLRPGRQLWRYNATTTAPASPAVGAPSAVAVRLLVDTATPSWPHPIAVFDRALTLGQLPVEDLLGLLVHPPARPDRFADLPDGYWERAAQVFACLGILHCRELNREGRYRLLNEIAFGVEDWSVEAALFALTVAAWLDPSCREQVRETVGQRFRAALGSARHREVTILGSLATLVRIVPGMSSEVTALADQILTAIREDPAPSDPRAAPGRRSAFARMFRRRRR